MANAWIWKPAKTKAVVTRMVFAKWQTINMKLAKWIAVKMGNAVRKVMTARIVAKAQINGNKKSEHENRVVVLFSYNHWN